MKQEDKELLLKDLCSRLPYGVKCQWSTYYKGILIDVCKCKTKDDFIYWDCYFEECGDDVPIEIVKPYLRPMSSMTEEEKKDILQSLNIHGDIDNKGNLLLGVGCDIITLKVCKKYLGELNKRMFDVCHMIEKGLALEAPEEMYKIG